MKVRRSMGLVGAGGVNRTFLGRMPAIAAGLGPVKGAALNVSRRIANTLRAGTGVSEYAELKSCDLIWIAVPEAGLDEIGAALAAAIPLERKMIVVCDALRDSLAPGPLRTAGARVATLNCVPDSDELVFIAEGHQAVLSQVRKLLTRDGRRMIELKPFAKPLYLSGIHLGGHLLLPWIAGAVESLRASGFTRAEATRTVQALGSRALRAYVKAGNKSFHGADAERLHAALRKETGALRRTDRRLEILYSEGSERLFQFFAETDAVEKKK